MQKTVIAPITLKLVVAPIYCSAYSSCVEGLGNASNLTISSTASITLMMLSYNAHTEKQPSSSVLDLQQGVF